MKLLGLLLILLAYPLHADEIRLHILRSPYGIDWRSPWALTKSALKNQAAPVGRKRAFSISHIFVELKCDSTGAHIMRGMTSASNREERDLLLRKHYGLGVMLHVYQGKLEKEDTIRKDLAPYKGHYRKAELAIKVSPESCNRMVSYAHEYESLGYGSMYSGFQADPLKREGAGCSAFAVSFLRVGGLMETFTREWLQKIDIPKKVIGGPITGKRVKLVTLLANPFVRWNNKVPHIHIDAWDPEKMHTWVKRLYYKVQNGDYDGKWPAEISREKNTLKVKLNMEARDTPRGGFWL